MKIILASKSGVRKQILDNYNIDCDVEVSNVDEDQVKNSLLAEGANPLLISKNLEDLKSDCSLKETYFGNTSKTRHRKVFHFEISWEIKKNEYNNTT